MMHLPTVTRMAAKCIRYPDRAVKGALEVIRLRRLDPDRERQKLFAFLRDVFGVDPMKIQDEFDRSGFADWSRARREELANYSGPYRFGSTPEVDCESLYYLVRALRPRIVVETGVCYGASSSYILEALAANGKGELYSIDLGNTEDEPPHDFFVPRRLWSRWHLCIGDSQELLPSLLRQLGEIDLFHHDSLHTYEHMMWEYETAFPWLSPDGVLSSHDVSAILSLRRPFRPNPFAVFCERHHLRAETAVNFGLATAATPQRAQRVRRLRESAVEEQVGLRERKRA
jgi:predicted O-methyltransferase YrrM